VVGSRGAVFLAMVLIFCHFLLLKVKILAFKVIKAASAVCGSAFERG
jgi:hypothetical protein